MAFPRLRSAARRTLAPLVLLAPACVFGRDTDLPRMPLPVDWDTVEPRAFEELLAESFPPGGIVYFDRAGRLALVEALDRMDAVSVRAALLFAHSRHPKSAGRLLRRLQEREQSPDRGGDAGDIVAAAALPRFPNAAELYRDELRALAVGRKAHPDLEVRVECAVSAMALGDDAPIPFLLQVLRIDTFAGRSGVRDFETDEHTAWARGRAAHALSLRAGVPVDYRTDGSIADREREAARLERLLRTEEP